ncbi:ATPase [Pseudomonas koreensis]|uniref:ATPase n=3 Tax=Pseudomonas TaxID=286 RepID=A0A4Q4KUE1_9PSED|nr:MULTISPECIES: AAA family ATPase [Pseudomonas]MCK1791936.1 AAA family ATPase [Pseudomonas violetae]MDM8193938.1 AAA family ATPase [Pseudomonas fluorescens]MDP8575183.1 AAA family ATPase [Pseudomonas iranensis]RYM37574.1 ATPase [Pseudomonas koreensis]
MITRLEATRYRCFERLGIEVGDFQVLVGANGSGKTTLLDLPELFGDLLRTTNVTSAFLERRNGMPARAGNARELLFAGAGKDFSLAVEARLPADVANAVTNATIAKQRGEKARAAFAADSNRWPTHLRYEIAFEVAENGAITVRNEYLFLFPSVLAPERNGQVTLHGVNVDSNKNWLPVLVRDSRSGALFSAEAPRRKQRDQEAIDLPGNVLALARVLYESAAEFPAARWFFGLLTERAVFLEPNWVEMRQASLPGQPNTIIRSGRNIPWLALDLKNDEKAPDSDSTYRSERFADWIAHVQTALPQIVDIDVREREDDHHAYFRVTYRGGFTVPQSSLSDGTLRILTLTLLPYLRKPPSILVTEEPENGIHPRAIEAVLQSLSSMYDSQVWVSSHSPVVLASANLDQLLCARLVNEGSVEMVAGTDHPRLQEWRGGIDLGSLFAAGVLG